MCTRPTSALHSTPMRVRSYLLLCLGLAVATGPARALADEGEPYQTPEYIREPATLPEGVNAAAARRMTLADAIQVAVANNLGVVLSRQYVTSQRYSLAAAKGAFEPEVTARVSHSDSVSPPSTAQEGSAGEILSAKDYGWNVGISHSLRTGTQLSVDMTNSRSSSSLGTAVSPLVYRSALGFSITQPLLKGFSFDREVPSASILRAEFSTERAREDMRTSIASTIKSTEDAYWDLVQALKSYHVQLASLELAKEQVRLTKRQIAAGILAPVDLINAEGTLAQRELSMVQSESAIESAADRLRQVLNLPQAEWKDPIVPSEAPTFAPSTLSLTDAISTALSKRPEMRQREIDVERARFDVRVAENDRLPELDFTFSYGLLGQEDRYRTALEQLTGFDARAWSAYLSLTWNPFNRAASAQLEGLQASEHSARLQLEREQLDIRVSVRDAVRSIETAARQVRAAAKFRSLAERNLDAEQRKFLNGTSSNFFVAQRQAELAQAQLSELNAVVQHRKALANLQLEMGTNLDKNNIRLEVAGKRK